MKIRLLCMGKTNASWIKEGIDIYAARIKHYFSFEVLEIPDPKCSASTPPSLVKEKEGVLFLKNLQADDILILLDENGKQLSSQGFATFIEKHMQTGSKRINFAVGGAFGFSRSIQERANYTLSLSPMTLTHQMVRPFFVEQLYRAITIINNHPYHNT